MRGADPDCCSCASLPLVLLRCCAVLKSGVLFFNCFGLGTSVHREARRYGEVNVGGCEVRAESGR